jgi:hypothetical protein
MTTSKSLPTVFPSFIQRVLYADHTVSGLSGLAFVAAPAPIARFIGWSDPRWIFATGILLIAFSAGLFFIARQPRPDRRLVWAAVGLNAAWVAASFALVVTGWLPLAPAGKWAVLIVADVVAAFAALEIYALRRG